LPEKANMLVLIISNFQGTTIKPIVPRQKHFVVFVVHHQIFFRGPVRESYWIIFNFFRWQPWRPNVKFEGKKQTNTDLIIFQFFIFYKPPCLQKNFNRRVLSIRVFSADGHYMAPRTNTITSGDQFKPIRIGENLVVNYHTLVSPN